MKHSSLQYFLIIFYFAIIIFTNAREEQSTTEIELSESKQCRDDIRHICNKRKYNTNFEILKCLHRSEKSLSSITIPCQQLIWNYKNLLLSSDIFFTYTTPACTKDFSRIKKCYGKPNDEKIICLLKNKAEIKSELCLSQVNEFAEIVFADVLLVHKFLSNCYISVNKLQCGRLQGNSSIKFSSDHFQLRIITQTKTIDCLVNGIDEVEPACKKQILRLGELQADDYHLNPALYHACTEERDKLCGNVVAGKSRIYACLESHKQDLEMSDGCRKAIIQKQKLESKDYKIRGLFSEECAEDIQKHRCVISIMKDKLETMDLPDMLMCLLRADHNERLKPHCRNQVYQARAQMAQDPIVLDSRLSKDCRPEIRKYCSSVPQKNETIIYCLMRASLPANNFDFSRVCKLALKQFIKIVDPTENIVKLDPVISKACYNEIHNGNCHTKLSAAESSSSASSSSMNRENEMYQCLLRLISNTDEESVDDDNVEEGKSNKKKSMKVSENCRENLLTLGYYIEQDYSLNNKLFQVCHKDAVKLCHANDQIESIIGQSLVPHATIHCLIRKWNIHVMNTKEQLPKDDLSNECSLEIKELVKLEATNLRLNFNVYKNCLTDVVKFCRVNQHKLDCLQVHYTELDKSCKASINQFLSLDAEDYSLKKMISRSCSSMVTKFCHSATSKKMDYILCLLDHKSDSRMVRPCRIALEHYQIINLENIQINHKFTKYCNTEIFKFCPKLAPTETMLADNEAEHVEEVENEGESKRMRTPTKSKLVTCLSKVLTTHLLKHKRPFSPRCYDQFKFEFIQRSSATQGDEELDELCKQDKSNYCPEVEQKDISNCLAKYHDKLSIPCRSIMSDRQLLGTLNNHLDDGLRQKCGVMIENYCSDQPDDKIFICLHHNMRTKGFDRPCYDVVVLRLHNRLVDVRLNPNLLDVCKHEIVTYCNVNEDRINNDNLSTHDKNVIISCLRKQFIEHRKFLKANCRILVNHIIMDANIDVHLDPELENKCRGDIKANCTNEITDNSQLTEGNVHNCLKRHLLDRNIANFDCRELTKRLLLEGYADVHNDPQLYAVCKNEIHSICQSETIGSGRKLSCLLWAMQERSVVSHMSQTCLTVLKERKVMWEFASKMDAPDSVKDMLIMAKESESRYYLLFMFIGFLLTFLFMGLMCGRYCSRRRAAVRRKRF